MAARRLAQGTAGEASGFEQRRLSERMQWTLCTAMCSGPKRLQVLVCQLMSRGTETLLIEASRGCCILYGKSFGNMVFDCKSTDCMWLTRQ